MGRVNPFYIVAGPLLVATLTVGVVIGAAVQSRQVEGPKYALRVSYGSDLQDYDNEYACRLGAMFVRSNPDISPDGFVRYVDCVKLGARP